MRSLLLVACLTLYGASSVNAQVAITKSPTGWELTNGHVHLTLIHASDSVRLTSLRSENGAEWALAGTSLIASPDRSNRPYQFVSDTVSDLEKGGRQLTLQFKSDDGGLLSLELKLYPSGAVIQAVMKLKNDGQHNLLLDGHIDRLCLTLENLHIGLN